MKKAIILIALFAISLLFLLIFVSCGVVSQQSNSGDITTGLVAYYAFNESSGTTASDSSGNNLDGTVIGASWVTGRKNNALSFDGTDDLVVIPASGEVAPTQISTLSAGTVAFWFKFDGEAGTTGIFYPAFFIGPSPEVSATKDGIIIEVGHKGIWNTSQELFYTITQNTTSAAEGEPISCFDSGTDLTAGQWYHFAVVVDENSNTGYLNGQEMTGREYNFGSSSDSYFLDAVSGGILSIGYGRSAINGEFYYYDGTIDEVRIYSRALSATDIQSLYEN